MDDLTSDVQGLDAQLSADTNQQEAAPQESQGQQAPGGNPAWAPLREKLDPLLFKQIEPDLQNWDREAQKRIETVNQQFAPFKAMVDQGATPQVLQASLRIAQEIEADPVAFHTKLTQYLQETGHMPRNQEELADALEDDDSGQDPLADDPRIQQLIQQQQQFMQAVQAQQEAVIRQQAESELDAETSALRAAHPELGPEDIQEVIRRAAATAALNRQLGKNVIPTLEEAYTELAAYQDRIRSAPRAGDSAPRLLPTSAGLPSASSQRKSIGQLTGSETSDLLAGLIDQSRAG